MNVEHYTSLHFPKRSMQLSQIFSIHFEPLLLSLLVLTGLIGSIYLFGQHVATSNVPSNIGSTNPNNALISSIFLSDNDENVSDGFSDYISMEGKPEAGKPYSFEFLKDETASRYVLEMGDGVRLIVTQKNLQHQYKLPGKYVIELKEIKGGLLNLIGTKKIKVK